jgi:hypothetical protein
MTFGNDGNFYAIMSNGLPRGVLKYDGTTGEFISMIVPINGNTASAFHLLSAPDVPEPTSAGVIIGCVLMMSLRRR